MRNMSLLSFLGGVLSDDIAKKAFEGLLGKGIDFAGEAAIERFKIQKGGKGLEDEIIFCEITLDSTLLDTPTQKELDSYLAYLKKYDKDHGTKRHEDFILFIAKGAESLKPKETYPKGEGKDKPMTRETIRVVERGVNFIKVMIKHSSKNKERMEFCLNRRVFDESIEIRRAKLNDLFGKTKNYTFAALDISSWEELNLKKLKKVDRKFANKIETARLKANPNAKRGKPVEIPGMLELATFGLSKKIGTLGSRAGDIDFRSWIGKIRLPRVNFSLNKLKPKNWFSKKSK